MDAHERECLLADGDVHPRTTAERSVAQVQRFHIRPRLNGEPLLERETGILLPVGGELQIPEHFLRWRGLSVPDLALWSASIPFWPIFRVYELNRRDAEPSTQGRSPHTICGLCPNLLGVCFERFSLSLALSHR